MRSKIFLMCLYSSTMFYTLGFNTTNYTWQLINVFQEDNLNLSILNIAMVTLICKINDR